MNLYKISQTVNNDYDTYDSAVVAAKDEEAARKIKPSSISKLYFNPKYDYTWAKSEQVTIEYLGKADKSIKAGVICASFNAG